MKPIDLLKAKDAMIRFRASSEVKKKLEMDAERFGISSSKLALYALTNFLVLSPADQKALLEGGQTVPIKRGKVVLVMLIVTSATFRFIAYLSALSCGV